MVPPLIIGNFGKLNAEGPDFPSLPIVTARARTFCLTGRVNRLESFESDSMILRLTPKRPDLRILPCPTIGRGTHETYRLHRST